MRPLLSCFLTLILVQPILFGQTQQPSPAAAKIIQPQQSHSAPDPLSQNADESTAPPPVAVEVRSSDSHPANQIRIPAGTKLDVEAAYTVSSENVRPGELLSFRVLVPVKVGEATVIEEGALVSGRVVQAKRGGHWGKAGRLSWTMEDVVARDGTRIPIQIDEPTSTKGTSQSSVKGTSHGGEVATRTVVLGVLLAPVFPIAPLALMQGFKRGENAVLPKGKRLVVFVSADTTVKVGLDSTK